MTLIDHGWNEVKRRWQRYGFRKQLAAHERERARRLAQLGQHAMHRAIDLSAYTELRDRVEKVTAEIAGIAQGAKSLESELTELRARRQAADAELDARRDALHAEHAALTAQAAKPDPAESTRLSNALAAVATERRRLLDPIDAEVARVTTQLESAATNVKSIEEERQTRLIELGQALYDRRHPDPALTEPIAAVTAEDERRTLTQAAFDASLADTRAMPPDAFRNFVVAALVVAAVVIGVPVGGYSWWSARRSAAADADLQQLAGGADSAQATPPSVNPLLQHEFASLPAYVLANRLSDAKTAEEAQTVLLEVFRAIGLGVYRPNGTQVLAGGERSERDFFLYDFQWRILARTQIAPSYLDFETFATVLGTEVVPLQMPLLMTEILGPAIHKRYVRALTNPTDPNSFIVLFIDGLARRQPNPYSLSDMQFNAKGQLPISPVQSVLLMMDFFMKPPGAPERAALGPRWRNAFTVHAAGPCDLITSRGRTELLRNWPDAPRRGGGGVFRHGTAQARDGGAPQTDRERRHDLRPVHRHRLDDRRPAHLVRPRRKSGAAAVRDPPDS